MGQRGVLECAIHQRLADDKKSREWLLRFTNNPEEMMLQSAYGDFLYYNGDKVVVMDNQQYKYYSNNKNLN